MKKIMIAGLVALGLCCGTVTFAATSTTANKANAAKRAQIIRLAKQAVNAGCAIHRNNRYVWDSSKKNTSECANYVSKADTLFTGYYYAGDLGASKPAKVGCDEEYDCPNGACFWGHCI